VETILFYFILFWWGGGEREIFFLIHVVRHDSIFILMFASISIS